MTPGANTADSPLVLVILDGVGLQPSAHDNAVAMANAPFLHAAISGSVDGQPVISMAVKAHGPAVGLLSESDMGNSEVGHNIMGAGRIFDQGAKQVEAALDSGDIWGPTWESVIKRRHKRVHFLGLLSDGNVHSHIRHLVILLERAAVDGAEHLAVHALFDGRDVIDGTAEEYLRQLTSAIQDITTKYPRTQIVVGSGGGRMHVTMDRYDADWDIVQRGWDAHIVGTARPFSSAEDALAALRSENPGISDQYLPAFTVVGDDGTAVAPVQSGETIVLFNFRGDRMIEMYRALTEEPFDKFERGPLPADLAVVGMTLYDGDLGIPAQYLVKPTRVQGTVSEILSRRGIAQFACAETQKFGHVTYFWNGNRSEKFDDLLETYVEIPSDKVAFDQRPRMKAAETGDELVRAIKSAGFPFIRANFAGGDMVGHTGSIPASIIAIEAIDEALAAVHAAVAEAGGTLIITADHGNCEVLIERDTDGNPVFDANGGPVPKKSHTISPVPFLLLEHRGRRIIPADIADPGISNIGATVLSLLGVEVPSGFRPSLVKVE